VSDERFLNSYHNASTPPGPDVPAELAAFMLAVDPVLAQAAELARVLARAHQGAATHLIGEDWSHARKYFSLSEKYAAWADYQQPAVGYGIHAYAHKVHPPMRGWLAVPLIGFDGQNYGFIQASDRLEGDFTEQDEANLVRLATVTSAALDGLAQLHLPEYQDKVGT
jgi:GAF domain-containing protein